MAIISPIQNDAYKTATFWKQTRPVITQKFGLRPEVYKQFGMKGHNGVDMRCKVGTPIFAPMDGYVKVKDSKDEGYGLHIRIRNEFKALECVLGHMSKVVVPNGHRVNMGDLIAYSGNSGFSSGPHLHMGLRVIIPGSQDIWSWKVLNASNGYFGYFDHLDTMLCFKGGFTKNSI